MSERHYAIIDPASPRAAAWVDVLGTDCLEVTSPEPFAGESPEGDPELCYFARVEVLSRYQLGRLVAAYRRVPGLDDLDILAELLGEEGLRILAEDVVITIDPVEGRIRLAMRGTTSWA